MPSRPDYSLSVDQGSGLSLDSSHWISLGPRKFSVLSEEEFKGRHKGDLSRSRFIYAKQGKNESSISMQERGQA